MERPLRCFLVPCARERVVCFSTVADKRMLPKSRSTANGSPSPGGEGRGEGEPVAPSSGRSSSRTRLAEALWMVVVLLVCGVAISNRSYWIDEAGVAWKGSLPTLADWWQALSTEASGNLQLPFYHLFAWGWERIAGMNEFPLRAGNALWLLAGVLVLIRAVGDKPRLRSGILVALLCSPFAWYYLNEARPYALQTSVSLVVLSALYRLGQNSRNDEHPGAPASLPASLKKLAGKDASAPGVHGWGEPDHHLASAAQVHRAGERSWVVILCIGSAVLAASGLLAMLWLGAYLGGAALSSGWDRCRNLARRHWMIWTPTLGLLLAIGLFYLWTLSLGARATMVGGTDFRNLLFIPYELLGFSGLGPGRLVLRAGAGGAFRPWLPWLAVYGIVLGAVLVVGWRDLRGGLPRRTRLCWVAAFLLVAGFILAVGVAVRFRVLGRHAAPVLPICLWILGSGLALLIERRRPWALLAVGLFVGLSLVSCLMLRFDSRHAKDDYRGAAALAREALARGQTVWWSADMEGARVYRVPITIAPGASNAALHVANPSKGFAGDLPRPDLVLTSKPDIYDNQGALGAYLGERGFHCVSNLTAFGVWR
jgi:hypothetical protein